MNKNKKTTPVDAEVVQEPEVSTQIVAQDNQIVKPDFDIDGFLDMRKQFITKVNAIMVKGSDYHEIQGKKSLAKGGAEKIASIFGWVATFSKDTEVSDAFVDLKGLVAFTCNLEKAGTIVGQGRGAAILSKNAGDPNKTIKMAQKSAFIDAVLRASGLSDFFTQDLEDMNANDIGQTQTSTIQPSEKQINLIKDLMEQKNVTEEMLFDEGFDLKNLTGGKEGTASELIAWLFAYKPTFEQGKGKSNYRGSAGLSSPNEDDKAFVMFCKDFDKCQTVQEYEQICSDIRLARENKKISEATYSQLVAVAKQVVEKIKKTV